ncbi:uncharacterized protein STEHIDRAFT_122743 [Stereum hirsutum FP-91666 SS1]|uniref:uncharacterized protein n=1 Tax=Stereum hirsutum (strain FP-91666) TaxID=721885 RepID=UPI000444A783|nr:uncharacterized protein STEHIDRAFT_122743 [Stereum hirsutum FP-91666 SS1]EIM84775.1 hypothetical protein STEHIDRAFT_122743 [Stereum hirsutum FP-91666 SS1]
MQIWAQDTAAQGNRKGRAVENALADLNAAAAPDAMDLAVALADVRGRNYHLSNSNFNAGEIFR